MSRSTPAGGPSPLAFVGDYVLCRCGIATFTHNLCEAVAAEGGRETDVFTVAVNDTPEGYDYPDRVRFEIQQAVQADYRLAADFVNIQQVAAVCLQHEYGIYGGACGSHILSMLKRLRRPLVTTMHTVLKQPDEQQRVVLQEIARLSDRVVIMSNIARSILREVFDVPAEKIVVIPHGIPDVSFVDPSFFKDQFGAEGRRVLLTFGLLSPGKGLEYAIEALPEVVKKHPDIIYVILGQTHPHVRRTSGEEYRNTLTRRVDELGLSDHVLFVNRFVGNQELVDYLGAADIYLTPYLGEAQVTSGTLAYAMGAGKPVISTPYWHAQEMLADGRGILVPFRDSHAMSEQILYLLDNETERHAIRKRAYTYTRSMTWSNVARQYIDTFAAATTAWVGRERYASARLKLDSTEHQQELPEVDLRHMRTMTDGTGMLQHCLYATPNREHGYCVDDNARALIAMAIRWSQSHDEEVLPLMQVYLAFLAHALDSKTGRFRNFMGYDRRFSEAIGSEDSHARALWALGTTVALGPHESTVALATHLFQQALPVVEDFASPRAWSYGVLGIHAYLRRFSGDSDVRRYRAMLAEKLFKHMTEHMTDDWPWCEQQVTYANAKLPHALLMSGKWMQRPDMIDVGKRTLDWLVRIQTNESGMLSIIGTAGWYTRDGHRARFDQQPIEAHGLVEACIEAYHVTRERHWIDYAWRAFNWFLGGNDLRTPLYDFKTGGCRDGLHADRVNENQGAESTLAWLQSLLMMHELQIEQTLDVFAEKSLSDRSMAQDTPGPVVAAKARDNVTTDRNDQ